MPTPGTKGDEWELERVVIEKEQKMCYFNSQETQVKELLGTTRPHLRLMGYWRWPPNLVPVQISSLPCLHFIIYFLVWNIKTSLTSCFGPFVFFFPLGRNFSKLLQVREKQSQGWQWISAWTRTATKRRELKPICLGSGIRWAAGYVICLQVGLAVLQSSISQ